MTETHGGPTGPERSTQGSNGLLAHIDRNQGPLARAMEIQRRCASVGFDWNDPSGARKKVFEEIAELDEAVDLGIRERMDSEVGDVILAVLNWARLLGSDPTQALDGALDRFEARFRLLEERVRRSGKSLQQASLEELEAAWQAAKMRLEPERNAESDQNHSEDS